MASRPHLGDPAVASGSFSGGKDGRRPKLKEWLRRKRTIGFVAASVTAAVLYSVFAPRPSYLDALGPRFVQVDDYAEGGTATSASSKPSRTVTYIYPASSAESVVVSLRLHATSQMGGPIPTGLSLPGYYDILLDSSDHIIHVRVIDRATTRVNTRFSMVSVGYGECVVAADRDPTVLEEWVSRLRRWLNI